jgi:hypothetical protein
LEYKSSQKAANVWEYKNSQKAVNAINIHQFTNVWEYKNSQKAVTGSNMSGDKNSIGRPLNGIAIGSSPGANTSVGDLPGIFGKMRDMGGNPRSFRRVAVV